MHKICVWVHLKITEAHKVEGISCKLNNQDKKLILISLFVVPKWKT